jgi:hypothetical protein
MKYIGSKGESRYTEIDRYVLKPQIIQESLSIIRSIWQRLPDERRPWGVWISYHEPIAVSAERTDTNVISAWFLTSCGITRENPWDYVRFRVIHSSYFWCSKMSRTERSPIFGGVHEMHEIGLASFAQIDNQPLIYLGYMWGGTYGRGDRYRIDSSNKLIFDTRVWVS